MESNPQAVESDTAEAVNGRKPSKGKGKRPSESKERRAWQRKNPTQLPSKLGRPAKALSTAVVARIIDGLHQGMSLKRLCELPGMPAPRTVADWWVKDPAFSALFARARDDGADWLVDEAQDIADALTRDNRKPTSEEVQAAKLQCEMRWKRAACFRPSKYGQKAMLEHAGAMSIQVVTGVPARRPAQPIAVEAATSPQDAVSALPDGSGTVTRIVEAGASYVDALQRAEQASDSE